MSLAVASHCLVACVRGSKVRLDLTRHRLPDGSKGADHIQDIFGRMGFSDKVCYIVPLLLGLYASYPSHFSTGTRRDMRCWQELTVTQEIVALSGAHSLGRCHPDRSGFDGPWVVNPTRFSNQYFKLLMTQKWKPREWEGPFQYVLDQLRVADLSLGRKLI